MSTWMVVEDEPDIYEVLLAMFNLWGIEGVAFVDGEEAAAWINDVNTGRFQGDLPELALIDIRLPGTLQGTDVGALLRQSDVLGEIAIVYDSAYVSTPEFRQSVIATSNPDLWLDKPLPHFEQLKQMLEDVIAKRRALVAARKGQVS